MKAVNILHSESGMTEAQDLIKYVIRGKYNEIDASASIGKNTIISGWTFIGKNAKIGKDCRIANYVEINSDVKIGENTNIQVFVVLNSNTKVGKNCMIAGHVSTMDERYPTPDTKSVKRTPCVIGNNVVIGGGALLVCCKIGNNSVVGAGSVVISNIPKNQVWAGNPAKPMKNKFGKIMSRKEFDLKKSFSKKIMTRNTLTLDGRNLIS